MKNNYYVKPNCKHRQDICEHLCGKIPRREAPNSSPDHRATCSLVRNTPTAVSLDMERDTEELMVASEVNSFTQNVSTSDICNISR